LDISLGILLGSAKIRYAIFRSLQPRFLRMHPNSIRHSFLHAPILWARWPVAIKFLQYLGHPSQVVFGPQSADAIVTHAKTKTAETTVMSPTDNVVFMDAPSAYYSSRLKYSRRPKSIIGQVRGQRNGPDPRT
jgi:hypothetical protein